jgi:Asp-tRNA(Asn)/Glu-tRNA(Gln) amidotransferase A subunit family amidase
MNKFSYLFISLCFITYFLLIAPRFVSSLSGKDTLTVKIISQTEKMIGLQFSPAERDSMMDELKENLENYEKMREISILNNVPMSIYFNPLPAGFVVPHEQKEIVWSEAGKIEVPQNLERLAFASIRDLAELIQTRKITSTQLTRMYLERLKRFNKQLYCVITLTEDLALEQAKKADQEIAAGKYRGFLHGIPYGAKDLLAVPGYKTTWGAMPYREQYLNEKAAVVQRLEEAGAVLLAKLSLGALAWGDVWYGAKTRNPWNIEQGSSGSSAGSASATAAGLVTFAIGSETWGSIVSPSTRCGTSGLRPTFGRISRAGAMALSWSMDKLGPICRTVEDCAIVFDAIRGADGIDPTAIDVPFNYDANLKFPSLKIGYLKSEFEKDTVNRQTNDATLSKLRDLGINLVPVELPDLPVYPLSFILSAEAAAAFDELTRSGEDSLLVRQIKNAWPNVFRASRFIPAVEYIQANRIRYRHIQKFAEIFNEVDVYVSPSFGPNLLLTNLTGHPCVVVPNGFNDEGSPTSITFIGNLYDEARLLGMAKIYQDATDFHLQYPLDFQ